MNWLGFVEGDYLYLTDLGFALLCLLVAGLVACLVREIVLLSRLWKRRKKL
jgi:hypothetical protein